MSFVAKQQMVFINGGGIRKKLLGHAFTEISDVVARFSSAKRVFLLCIYIGDGSTVASFLVLKCRCFCFWGVLR